MMIRTPDLADRTPAIDQSAAFHLLDGLPIGVFIIDRSGRRRYTNAVALELFGRTVDPVVDPVHPPAMYELFVAGSHDPYPQSQLPSKRALAGERSHRNSAKQNF